MHLVLIDVDGTLITMHSSERRFFAWLLHRGLFGPRQAFGYIAFLIRYGPRLGSRVWKKNKGYLAGLQWETVQQAAATFVEDDVLPTIRESLRMRMLKHAEAGDRMCLLTGTPDFIARPLAEAVGVPDVIATRCAVENGRFAVRPPLQHPYAEDKLRLAKQWAMSHGYEIGKAVAYGNAASDIPLLKAVGTPVAVAPDQRLRRTALDAGWEIVDE